MANQPVPFVEKKKSFSPHDFFPWLPESEPEEMDPEAMLALIQREFGDGSAAN
ncbi:MAG: hypothetical protein ACRD3Q_14805 [Terriglobales bacterium]